VATDPDGGPQPAWQAQDGAESPTQRSTEAGWVHMSPSC
jgi:hypothetical protein